MEHWRKRIKPFPDRIRVLNFQAPSALTSLNVDWLPESMDDKWIGLLSENSIDLCRSWSGIHVYRIELQSAQNGMRSRLLINADPNQVNRLYIWLFPHRWLVRFLISCWHADAAKSEMIE